MAENLPMSPSGPVPVRVGWALPAVVPILVALPAGNSAGLLIMVIPVRARLRLLPNIGKPRVNPIIPAS